jgi:hypothetical protein
VSHTAYRVDNTKSVNALAPLRDGGNVPIDLVVLFVYENFAPVSIARKGRSPDIS